VAALDVCPDSAKVQLNTGILARRTQEWSLALKRFTRAAELEPVQYCEPSYWIGITLINSGDIPRGQAHLIAALDCKCTAVEAAKALHTVLMARLEANPADVDALLAGGDLLSRTAAKQDSCIMYMRAAAALEAAGKGSDASAARRKCDDSVTVSPAQDIPSLAACAEAVRDVTALLEPKINGPPWEEAMLAITQRDFMARHGQKCTLSQDYLVLIHRWQGANAYDAELHDEWARLLDARGGRDAEVIAHRNAARVLRQSTSLGHDDEL